MAFVTRDPFHRLTPYSTPSAADEPGKTPLDMPAQDARTKRPHKLLLVSSEPADSGFQGDVSRAYCANSPFPLVIKYTDTLERRESWQEPHRVTDEIDFYRAHGTELAAAKIAPRFVGGWTMGRNESPCMGGLPTAVIIMEDCGEALRGKKLRDVDMDVEGRQVHGPQTSDASCRPRSILTRSFLADPPCTISSKPCMALSDSSTASWRRSSLEKSL